MSKTLKSNHEIITIEAASKGFNYTGNNLFTYGEWLERGYVVVRGQRAFIRAYLWINGKDKRKKINFLFKNSQVTKINVLIKEVV